MKTFALAALLATIFGVSTALAESSNDKQTSLDKDSAPKPVWETDENLKKQMKSGKFSTCTLDPFTLCSHPRPGKKDPMRKCWDEVCG